VFQITCSITQIKLFLNNAGFWGKNLKSLLTDFPRRLDWVKQLERKRYFPSLATNNYSSWLSKLLRFERKRKQIWKLSKWGAQVTTTRSALCLLFYFLTNFSFSFLFFLFIVFHSFLSRFDFPFCFMPAF
jgi:hypothetical protein